ncbi:hypothetical protein Ccrd_013309 [Cynara cardunculus var. scolymus]|uniref:Uncharacterized protein n=1 Tax=Cynara cardunculus var. scolymus TaxID=59895 RepID=A0A103YFW8_CYNCS|nr:hypothetical protein Ccrd_013309 [Cynara cardunculus var. scolymus]
MTVNESSLLDPDFSDFSPEEEFGGMWHVHRHNSNFGRLHRRHPIAPTPVVSISADPTLLDLLLDLLLGELSVEIRNVKVWNIGSSSEAGSLVLPLTTLSCKKFMQP